MVLVKVTVHAKYTPNLEKVRTSNQWNLLCCMRIWHTTNGPCELLVTLWRKNPPYSQQRQLIS